jgi:hypothetical protein
MDSLGLDMNGGSSVTDDRRDSSGHCCRVTSDLVTRWQPKTHFREPSQGIAVGSSLVTPKWRIPEPGQPLAPLSSLVTTGLISSLFARNRGFPRARPALDSRAADHGSSHDSPASAASAVDWLSCSPHGIPAPSNTSAVSAYADGGNTALGNQGIDGAYFSRVQGILLARIMPGTRVRRLPRPRTRAFHRRYCVDDAGTVIVNAIPVHPSD